MSTPANKAPRFEDFLSVDVNKLRPNRSYDKMVEIRDVRMKTYLGPDGKLKPELVEEVPCPVCDSRVSTPEFEKEGFQFVKCSDCGLTYVNPALKDEHVRQVYKHQSYTDILTALSEPSDVYRRERFGKERVAIVNRFTGRKPGERARLLDVGCASGFFVAAAQDDGWDAHGIESNPYIAEFARKQGLNVLTETIEETSLPAASFRAVSLFEVIEHVTQPMPILRKVHDLLEPGGMIFLYTPNFHSAERLMLGNAAHYIWGANHLTYFTADSLASALDRAGFDVVHSETQGLDIEDVIWHFEHHGQYDMAFARAFRDELQFLINASGWGKNLRMYARKR
ncbi:MAG: class I SAM-dependent methyltransferase [Acidobacteriota bacterium]|nr:class I SAM-dependent methyltransferase [Acidobacteriota bacterium]